MRQTGSCPIHWSPSLATDLYELTMAAGYFASDRRARATFELFVRDLPARRSYLVAAGKTASSQLDNLPDRYKRLEGAAAYPVRFSSHLSPNR